MDKEGVPVSLSAVNDYPYILMPGDLNANNTVFGGRIMEIADRLAGTVAMRHSGEICVTLLVDSMKFLAPAKQGEAIVFQAAMNRAWGSSMEVGVKVYAEDMRKRTRIHILSAYFTFVAVNDDMKPIKIRPVIPETEEERRRHEAADVRRNRRIEYSKKN